MDISGEDTEEETANISEEVVEWEGGGVECNFVIALG